MTLGRLQVYHAVEPDFMARRDPKTIDTIIVADMSLDDLLAGHPDWGTMDALDFAFGLTNSIDFGWWKNPKAGATGKAINGVRSTSTGDFIVINGQRWRCETVGWKMTDECYVYQSRQDQLQAAFSRVQNAQHWKNPIDKTLPMITVFEEGMIRDAVIHFTGSVPTFTLLPGDEVRVQAPGYYKTIGA